MSDATTTAVDVGTTDAELFNEATTDTPAETPAVETEQAEPEKPTEQHRDEQGKFAKADETPVAETPAEKPVVDDNGAQVPSWRVREINEEKRQERTAREAAETERNQLRSQLEQLQRQSAKPVEQKPEAKPDPLLDPDGYEKYLEKRFEDRLVSERRESSLRLAHRTHKEAFTEAYASAKQAIANGDHALMARMNNSPDPGETLVEWHREQKTMREVGNDPNAFFQKRLDAYLADPANLGKIIERAKGVASGSVTQQARPAVDLPPSLSTSSRAGNTSTSADDSDVSDEALFKYAVR